MMKVSLAREPALPVQVIFVEREAAATTRRACRNDDATLCVDIPEQADVRPSAPSPIATLYERCGALPLPANLDGQLERQLASVRVPASLLDSVGPRVSDAPPPLCDVIATLRGTGADDARRVPSPRKGGRDADVLPLRDLPAMECLDLGGGLRAVRESIRSTLSTMLALPELPFRSTRSDTEASLKLMALEVTPSVMTLMVVREVRRGCAALFRATTTRAARHTAGAVHTHAHARAAAAGVAPTKANNERLSHLERDSCSHAGGSNPQRRV